MQLLNKIVISQVCIPGTNRIWKLIIVFVIKCLNWGTNFIAINYDYSERIVCSGMHWYLTYIRIHNMVGLVVTWKIMHRCMQCTKIWKKSFKIKSYLIIRVKGHLKFHSKYFTYTWKDLYLIQGWKFKSSLAFLKHPPEALWGYSEHQCLMYRFILVICSYFWCQMLGNIMFKSLNLLGIGIYTHLYACCVFRLTLLTYWNCEQNYLGKFE